MIDTHHTFLKSNRILADRQCDGTTYAEAIKGSNHHHTGIQRFRAYSGREECIDVVRGRFYQFVEGTLMSNQPTRGRTFITIKGGVNGCLLHNLMLYGKTRWPWDISLGDHTIYGYDTGPCTNIVINHVRHEDPLKKVTILVLHSHVPKCLNGNYRIIKVPKWIVKLLFWIKK